MKEKENSQTKKEKDDSKLKPILGYTEEEIQKRRKERLGYIGDIPGDWPLLIKLLRL